MAFRVALVCDYSLDYLGGAQTAFCAQVRALSGAGHHVTVIAPKRKASDFSPLRTEGVRFRVTLPIVGLPVIRNSSRLRKRIARVIDEENIDVIHVHSEFGLSAACADVAIARGVPVIHTVHTFFWQFAGRAAIQRPVSRAIRSFHAWVTGQSDPPVTLARSAIDSALRNMTLSRARHAHTVVSPSLHQRRLLLDSGLETVEHVSNTIVFPGRSRPSVLERADGPLRVLWVGRCSPEKRLLPFIRACIGSSASLPTGALEIVVVGAGPQLDDARKLAESHRWISFTGYLPQTEVLAQFEKAHVAALSSNGFDNQPMTIVEALFARRGVFYVDPALTESLHDAGILASNPDEAGIMSTLIRLVQNREIVCALSRHADEAFEQFTPAHFTQRVENVYSRAVADTGVLVDQ